MPSDFDPKYIRDVIGMGTNRRPARIVRRVGDDTVVMQELSRDRLGRLRSIGEEGRFSTTRSAVRSAPLYKMGPRKTKV
jgi:hypothetical protein